MLDIKGFTLGVCGTNNFAVPVPNTFLKIGPGPELVPVPNFFDIFCLVPVPNWSRSPTFFLVPVPVPKFFSCPENKSEF